MRLRNRGGPLCCRNNSRIIDAYHDLHVRKNELIKFYLTLWRLTKVDETGGVLSPVGLAFLEEESSCDEIDGS